MSSTTGTTGTTKGVCLSAEAMLQVADSLREACSPVDPQQHLILLPLAVLASRQEAAGYVNREVCARPALTRVEEVCTNDKSIAIAHDRTDLYESGDQ